MRFNLLKTSIVPYSALAESLGKYNYKNVLPSIVTNFKRCIFNKKNGVMSFLCGVLIIMVDLKDDNPRQKITGNLIRLAIYCGWMCYTSY